jgi:hypothetical protein
MLQQTGNWKQTAATAAYLASKNIPVWFWGPAGIGKSHLAAHLAKAAGAELHDVRLSLLESVDMRGLPVIKDGKTVWTRPDLWPSDGTKLHYLFLDELDRAPTSVRNAALQLVYDRRIGEHTLPDSVRIFAAGNGGTDKGMTQSIGHAMADRFAHLFMQADLAVYCDYATRKGFDIRLVSFLEIHGRKNPAIFHNPSPARDCLTNPTPRTWDRIAAVMDAPSIIRRGVFASMVGDDIAGELCAHIDMAGKIPPLATFLSDPNGAPVYGAGEIAINYSLALALARFASPANFDAIAQYARRMPREFYFLTMTAATKAKPDLRNSRAWIEYETAANAKGF